MGEDFHQRQPLLPQGDTQEEEEQLTLLTLSPRVIRYRLSPYRGLAVFKAKVKQD